ncbi:mitochondrial distribution regulator misato [Holotrichia oblita]|uniref:Mitochondrial distribution regulator misato n=1 Tax=Holotrichia oblita TaxID=644536 RepID=A0ACB9TJA4_HOLOL|nr:mitochondrial distribution regulator misato [Holotrichia oblita]
MTTREICSLQFGHYSNFIGAHWWNLQEFSFSFTPDDYSEINNRVLYREGLTLKGQPTYTPRVLLVDLKGSLNTLAEHGELYDTSSSPKENEIPWHPNRIEVKEDVKKPKSEFLQDLDSGPSTTVNKNYNFETNVKVWSDCLYTRFHPNTINVIKEYEHNNQDAGFDLFMQGKQMWKTEKFEDDFSDKIRNFVEECDSLQGFHVILDGNNGFSGLGSNCIEHLKDDYDRKSVLAIPVLPSYYNDYSNETDEEQRTSQIKDSIRVINSALSFTDLAESSSLFVPLCTSKDGWRQPGLKREFNHVQYNDKLMYHTSAILASALDTITLKYRLREGHYSLSDLCADLNLHNRKLAAASLCLPFSFNEGADLIECLDNWDGPLTQSITPRCTIGTDRMMQLITLRGIPEDRLKKPYDKAGTQKDLPAYRCKNVNEMLNFYMSCTTFGTATNVTNISKDVQSIPILAGLHSCNEISATIESLHTEAKKIKVERLPQFTSTGLEKDEYKECLEKLLDLKECYEENYLL